MKKIIFNLVFLLTLINFTLAQKKINFEAHLGLGLSNHIADVYSFPLGGKSFYPFNSQPILRPNFSLTANYEITPNLGIRLGVNYHWTGSYHKDTSTTNSSSFLSPSIHHIFTVTERERSMHNFALDISSSYQIKKIGYVRLGAYLQHVLSLPKPDVSSYVKITYTEYYTDPSTLALDAASRSYIYTPSGPFYFEQQDMFDNDYGIYGGIGKSWGDRCSAELTYWRGFNSKYASDPTLGWAYSLSNELLKLSFGYRFGRIDFNKK
ncbi:MAG: hypothetical protein RI894_2680 [Bacteroidota bacterium]|jgi:hypothetical protein